jgi:hypothetical protein
MLQNHLQFMEQFTESHVASCMPQQAILRELLEGFSQLVSVFIDDRSKPKLYLYFLHNKAAKNV